MNWEMLRIPAGVESPFKPYRHPNGLRCGWCIGGDHRNCVVAVETGHEVTNWSGPKDRVVTAWRVHIWTCECKVEAYHPSSRCTICLRPGVDVDLKSRCTDQDDCQAYRSEYGIHIRPLAPYFCDDDEGDDDEGDEEDYEDGAPDVAV